MEERWLKGEEYGFLLRHYKTYSQLDGYHVNTKCQEPSVYVSPQSKRSHSIINSIDLVGKVYYIKGMHLRHFGFPRLIEDGNHQAQEKLENLKKFLWKKTNFVTDMPKHGPISRYLVSKTSNRDVHYYMHVSILHHGKQEIDMNKIL